MLVETQEQLVEWGRWVRAGGLGDLGYSQMRIGLGSTVRTPMITDDKAVRVDGAVARLKRRDEVLGRVVIDYYVRSWDVQMVGEAQGVSRRTAAMLLRSAEAWIDGVLWGVQETG